MCTYQSIDLLIESIYLLSIHFKSHKTVSKSKINELFKKTETTTAQINRTISTDYKSINYDFVLTYELYFIVYLISVYTSSS